MPYIPPSKREKYDSLIEELSYMLKDEKSYESDGILNYIISKLIHLNYSLTYFSQNRAIGVLECIKQEQYRRVTAPYEDQKIKENGDI